MPNNLLHVSVFVTPHSGRPLRYLLKKCVLFAMLCYKTYNIPCLFKFTNLLQCLQQYVFHPSVSTQHTKIEEEHSSRISVPSISLHQYGPKHSWIQ